MLVESSSKRPIVMRIPSEVEERLGIYVYAISTLGIIARSTSERVEPEG